MKEYKLVELAKKIIEISKNHPNDSELGREVRKIVNETDKVNGIGKN